MPFARWTRIITETLPISRPRITLSLASNQLLNSAENVTIIGAAALYMAGFVGCTSTAACAYSMMLAVQSTFTDSKRNYWQFGWDVSYVGLCYFSARAYQTTVVPAQRLKAELLDYVGCPTNKPEYENDTISLKAGLIDASKKFFFGDVFARLEEEKMTKEKLILEKVALENSAREKEQDFDKREEILKRQLKEVQDEKREQQQETEMSEILKAAKVFLMVAVGATAIGLCMRGACHWKYFRMRGRLRESLRVNKDLIKSNMVQREELKKLEDLENAFGKKDKALHEQLQASRDAIGKKDKEINALKEQLEAKRDTNGKRDTEINAVKEQFEVNKPTICEQVAGVFFEFGAYAILVCGIVTFMFGSLCYSIFKLQANKDIVGQKEKENKALTEQLQASKDAIGTRDKEIKALQEGFRVDSKKVVPLLCFSHICAFFLAIPTHFWTLNLEPRSL